MPKKNNRTPQACIHLYNPPVSPAGYLSYPRSIAHPIFAKRTQSHVRARHAVPLQCETNPISRTPTVQSPQLCKTNPISTRRLPQISETNPIPPGEITKRTQFPTTNIHSTIYNIQSLGPICPTPTIRRPKNAKRTQFAAPPASHNIQYSPCVKPLDICPQCGVLMGCRVELAYGSVYWRE